MEDDVKADEILPSKPARKEKLLQQPIPSADATPSPSRWRSGLLLAGSFVLGGLAVTLWNRQTLAKLHQEMNGKGQSRQPSAEDEE